jgi:hypothetical protein
MFSFAAEKKVSDGTIATYEASSFGPRSAPSLPRADASAHAAMIEVKYSRLRKYSWPLTFRSNVGRWKRGKLAARVSLAYGRDHGMNTWERLMHFTKTQCSYRE